MALQQLHIPHYGLAHEISHRMEEDRHWRGGNSATAYSFWDHEPWTKWFGRREVSSTNMLNKAQLVLSWNDNVFLTTSVKDRKSVV